MRLSGERLRGRGRLGAEQAAPAAPAAARLLGRSPRRSVYVAAGLVAGVRASTGRAARSLVAAVIAVVNAVLPPVIAALRLPFTLVTGFLLVLFADAAALMLADELFPDVHRRSTRSATRCSPSLVMAAVSIVHPGDGRDQRRRRVHAAGDQADRPPPGRRRRAPTPRASSSSRSTASACRSCATRCATAAPRTWRAGSPRTATALAEWETDLSSQTGASQAGHPARLERGHPGLPLGREGDADDDDLLGARPTAPRSSAAARPAIGLLADGGASRGNLLSGEADEVILTVSRIEAEKRRQPRLPGLPRQRLQRHPRAGPVRLGGRARVDRGDPRDPPRRAPARPPRRHLPVPARRDVRDRPRPDRLRRAHAT